MRAKLSVIKNDHYRERIRTMRHLLYAVFGFQLQPGRAIHSEGPRVRKQVTQSEGFVQDAFLSADADTRLGEHWVTFAFKNLLGVDSYQVTDPIMINVIE